MVTSVLNSSPSTTGALSSSSSSSSSASSLPSRPTPTTTRAEEQPIPTQNGFGFGDQPTPNPNPKSKLASSLVNPKLTLPKLILRIKATDFRIPYAPELSESECFSDLYNAAVDEAKLLGDAEADEELGSARRVSMGCANGDGVGNTNGSGNVNGTVNGKGKGKGKGVETQHDLQLRLEDVQDEDEYEVDPRLPIINLTLFDSRIEVEDVEAFVRALFIPSSLPPPGPTTSISLDLLSHILNVSIPLRIVSITKRVVQHLEHAFPITIEGWVKVKPPKTKTRFTPPSLSSSSCPSTSQSISETLLASSPPPPGPALWVDVPQCVVNRVQVSLPNPEEEFECLLGCDDIPLAGINAMGASTSAKDVDATTRVDVVPPTPFPIASHPHPHPSTSHLHPSTSHLHPSTSHLHPSTSQPQPRPHPPPHLPLHPLQHQTLPNISCRRTQILIHQTALSVMALNIALRHDLSWMIKSIIYSLLSLPLELVLAFSVDDGGGGHGGVRKGSQVLRGAAAGLGHGLQTTPESTTHANGRRTVKGTSKPGKNSKGGNGYGGRMDLPAGLSYLISREISMLGEGPLLGEGSLLKTLKPQQAPAFWNVNMVPFPIFPNLASKSNIAGDGSNEGGEALESRTLIPGLASASSFSSSSPGSGAHSSLAPPPTLTQPPAPSQPAPTSQPTQAQPKPPLPHTPFPKNLTLPRPIAVFLVPLHDKLILEQCRRSVMFLDQAEDVFGCTSPSGSSAGEEGEVGEVGEEEGDVDVEVDVDVDVEGEGETGEGEVVEEASSTIVALNGGVAEASDAAGVAVFPEAEAEAGVGAVASCGESMSTSDSDLEVVLPASPTQVQVQAQAQAHVQTSSLVSTPSMVILPTTLVGVTGLVEVEASSPPSSSSSAATAAAAAAEVQPVQKGEEQGEDGVNANANAEAEAATGPMKTKREMKRKVITCRKVRMNAMQRLSAWRSLGLMRFGRSEYESNIKDMCPVCRRVWKDEWRLYRGNVWRKLGGECAREIKKFWVPFLQAQSQLQSSSSSSSSGGVVKHSHNHNHNHNYELENGLDDVITPSSGVSMSTSTSTSTSTPIPTLSLGGVAEEARRREVTGDDDDDGYEDDGESIVLSGPDTEVEGLGVGEGGVDDSEDEDDGVPDLVETFSPIPGVGDGVAVDDGGSGVNVVSNGVGELPVPDGVEQEEGDVLVLVGEGTSMVNLGV
ncbi:hypothetical protein BDN72DRAFT_841864 [Pluteus cervinus]|uniref:Uncharacterized protein n=1 Tax=Pluteus cervinus TaxID=181527 RepID=A0ACD3AS77_9AGAR|nr:hypothetical protein BDN72DRAFT_841864 [Pluteus cervinus]